MLKYPPIYSRKETEELIASGEFPENAAVISFCDTGTAPRDRVNYSSVCDRVMYVEIDDFERDELAKYGMTYDTFFPDADEVASFILDAFADKLYIMCQCEYGESRSAGCAAAIYEYFEGNATWIFSNYIYYPNKLIYHKILEELRAQSKRVELHAHTNMSLMKGLSPAGELISWAVDDEQPALAITDCGTVHAFPEASLAAGEEPYSFKTIYGMEGVLSDGLYKNSTLVILAKNQTGLKNLYKLVTLSHKEDPTSPRFSRETLSELREGLIIGSGSESGELFRAVAEKRAEDELWEIARFYDYLEICPSMPENICRSIVSLGEYMNIPVCAAGNVYYANSDSEIVYHIALNDEPRYVDSLSAPRLYFRDTDEMREAFEYLGKRTSFEVVVLNTNRIADSIEPIHIYPYKAPPIKITDEVSDGCICIGKIEQLSKLEAVKRVEEYAARYELEWLDDRIELFSEELAWIKTGIIPSGKYLTFPEGYDIEELTPLQYSSDGKPLMTHFDISFFEIAAMTAEEIHLKNRRWRRRRRR